MQTIQEQSFALMKEQAANWTLFRQNLEGLQSARLRTLEFDGFRIKLQFNPRRIVSSGAKVDKDSISKRRCFLCKNHREEEQRQVDVLEHYQVLCNPFPIFREHFSIAHGDHIPQEIGASFKDFLEISSSSLHSLMVLAWMVSSSWT